MLDIDEIHETLLAVKDNKTNLNTDSVLRLFMYHALFLRSTNTYSGYMHLVVCSYISDSQILAVADECFKHFGILYEICDNDERIMFSFGDGFKDTHDLWYKNIGVDKKVRGNCFELRRARAAILQYYP